MLLALSAKRYIEIAASPDIRTGEIVSYMHVDKFLRSLEIAPNFPNFAKSRKRARRLKLARTAKGKIWVRLDLNLDPFIWIDESILLDAYGIQGSCILCTCMGYIVYKDPGYNILVFCILYTSPESGTKIMDR